MKLDEQDLIFLVGTIPAARLLAKRHGVQDMTGGCLYHALAVNVLTGAPIVAGSYSWKFTDYDNGKNPTHFSCIFDETAQKITRTLLEKNAVDMMINLPEMHVWNRIGDNVFDISTAFIPSLARKTVGLEFEAHLIPPEYLLGPPRGPENRWLYQEHPLATQFIRELAKIMRNRAAKGLPLGGFKYGN